MKPSPHDKAISSQIISLLLMVPTGLIVAMTVESTPWIAWTTLIGVAVIAGLLSLKHNRCPHCKKSIDLRSRKLIFCPRCGKKIIED